MERETIEEILKDRECKSFYITTDIKQGLGLNGIGFREFVIGSIPRYKTQGNEIDSEGNLIRLDDKCMVLEVSEQEINPITHEEVSFNTETYYIPYESIKLIKVIDWEKQ